MPVANKDDDKIISLVKKEAKRFNATIKKIDLHNQILDVDCPNENKDECAVAIQKVLAKHFEGS